MRKVLLICLVLAGCSGAGPGTRSAMPQLALQPILYPDMVQNKLYGAACNFVPASGGMGAVFLAQDQRALIKLDDHIVAIPLAADAAPLPQGAHTHYAGPLYSASLLPAHDAKMKKTGGLTEFGGHLVITDAKAQPVYDADGDIQCRPT